MGVLLDAEANRDHWYRVNDFSEVPAVTELNDEFGAVRRALV